uniref:Myb-like domain-containing protein n=1 Tax=Arundo donax TaxID=35708 RepID=A0A0A9D512_ARUDO
MQQQQQPGMPPFAPASGTVVDQHAAPADPSPISSRPPEGQQQVDELSAGGAASAGSFDHKGLSAAAGDEGERGGTAGNRWPRQETLALLKIRSEMDAAFREAALKGPLWEQVSRRLEAMGYKRSAKKCREKFENVDKYYKRTKDGRAGRGDGKAYRFFSELEALHGASSPHPPSSLAMAPPATLVAPMGASGAAPPMHAARVHAELPPPAATVPQPAPSGTPAPAAMATAPPVDAACMMTEGDVSFSSGSDGEDTEETGDGGKRKRRDSGGGSSKVMRFFEGLMRQVMERQEEMQQRFIEAIERREQDRMIREEAWRRQEVARLAREQDALAQERAMAASRDAAVVSFIQRVTGQTIPMPSVAAPPSKISALIPPPLQPTPVASAAPAPAQHHQPASVQLALKPHIISMTSDPQPQLQPQLTPAQQENKEIIARALAESQDTVGSGGDAPSPSRWPKAEVHALIQLRTELEARYPDAGPKGPLWEDISAGMRRLGYNRSAKRCKEKWENINKYFKKVKECNKRRPEDSKTCPYFHQLDAMYRKKRFAGRGGTAGSGTAPGAGSGQENLNQRELDGKSINDAGKRNTDGESSVHAPAGKVETAPTTTALSNGAKSKKADDIVRETNVQLLQQEFTADETDSDGMGGNYADEGNDEDKMQYKMGFQKPSVIGSSGNAAATSPAAPTSSTFLDVQ